MAAPLTLLSQRRLKPHEIVLGGIWIGPGSGATATGDGDRPDLGQANADSCVAAAVAHGVTDFDTAPWYGAGASEERLGRAVAATSGAAVRVVTKTGRLFREPDGRPCMQGFDAPGRAALSERRCVNDYTSAGARISLAESLDRLGLAAVHGLRIHDPNDNSNNSLGAEGFVDEVEIALGRSGMVAALAELRAEGTIQHVSLGMNANEESHQGAPGEILRLLRGAEPGTFDSALLAGGWNLLSQAGRPCLEECERRGVEVHIAGVFASGLLAGGDDYAYKRAPAAMVERTERWRAIAASHSVSLPAVAIAFAARPKCVGRVVIGMATAEQVEQTMKWVEESERVTAAVWTEAEAAGLL